MLPLQTTLIIPAKVLVQQAGDVCYPPKYLSIYACVFDVPPLHISISLLG